MNGQQWAIAVYTGMIRHGEAEVTGKQVATIARALFPYAEFPAFEDEAEFEISQRRKHLAFLRDPCVADPPSIQQLLSYVSNKAIRQAAIIARRARSGRYQYPRLTEKLQVKLDQTISALKENDLVR